MLTTLTLSLIKIKLPKNRKLVSSNNPTKMPDWTKLSKNTSHRLSMRMTDRDIPQTFRLWVRSKICRDLTKTNTGRTLSCKRMLTPLKVNWYTRDRTHQLLEAREWEAIRGLERATRAINLSWRRAWVTWARSTSRPATRTITMRAGDHSASRAWTICIEKQRGRLQLTKIHSKGLTKTSSRSRDQLLGGKEAFFLKAAKPLKDWELLLNWRLNTPLIFWSNKIWPKRTKSKLQLNQTSKKCLKPSINSRNNNVKRSTLYWMESKSKLIRNNKKIKRMILNNKTKSMSSWPRR